MKKVVILYLLIFLLFIFIADYSSAQCSICTKTAQQLGEKPAKGLNAGIIYLAFTPYLIIGYIAYRWWSKNKKAA